MNPLLLAKNWEMLNTDGTPGPSGTITVKIFANQHDCQKFESDRKRR